jgi:serine/threonine protein kinase
LLQQIGEGGMGTVFMAEQARPVRRQVAIKLIRPGLDSHLVIARFEAERQALALMDHPNIARVLDAGSIEERPGERETGSSTDTVVTDQPASFPPGRPYFVMELVKGVPITRYCDDNHLETISKPLELGQILGFHNETKEAERWDERRRRSSHSKRSGKSPMNSGPRSSPS